MAKQPNGFVLWQGRSAFDGSPIAAIVTGCAAGSNNAKTGAMLQTWIIRTDVDPWTACNSGGDRSVCGDCKHRGTVVDGRVKGRTCYVRVYQAPLAIYKAFHRGIYPTVTSLDQVASIGDGRAVRIGSYGDPAAVPQQVWQALASRAQSHTGYTHAWHRSYGQALKGLVMASADTPQEREAARAHGWRTFTVRLASDGLAARESVCPASKEAGAKVNCADCGACNGAATGRKGSIAIIVHGAMARTYAAQRAAVAMP